ncbi:hypothetical protein [Lactococcus lactis]|uniref:hypothetical protein n=1 Tax=Lactococcus lactis TaxID=1358 RepID=UPI00285E12A9|nr:hypothetical protein [Lactococcus lactis]MDR7697556.1 hypothetical protein [Lactococcus lactis]
MKKSKKLDRLPVIIHYSTVIELVAAVTFLILGISFAEKMVGSNISFLTTLIIRLISLSPAAFFFQLMVAYGFRKRWMIDDKGIQYFNTRFEPQIEKILWKDISRISMWSYVVNSGTSKAENYFVFRIDVNDKEKYLSNPRLVKFLKKEEKRYKKLSQGKESYAIQTLVNLQSAMSHQEAKSFNQLLQKTWKSRRDND